MLYGRIPGVHQPVSRLVMGVDNQEDRAQAAAVFDDFVQRGGNCFDTAYIYGGGRMERLLGRWVSDRGIREHLVIVGKGASTPHCDPETLRCQLADSLDRLDTDHVDLYLMHRDNTDVPVGEFVDAMEEQLAAGRVARRAGSSPAGRTRTTTRTPSWSAAATATRTSAGWPAPSSSGRDWRYPPPPSLCPMCCISRSRRSR
jgi:aryl-alcohol dehydrogenase-like predicted oxidoreductase